MNGRNRIFLLAGQVNRHHMVFSFQNSRPTALGNWDIWRKSTHHLNGVKRIPDYRIALPPVFRLVGKKREPNNITIAPAFIFTCPDLNK